MLFKGRLQSKLLAAVVVLTAVVEIMRPQMVKVRFPHYITFPTLETLIGLIPRVVLVAVSFNIGAVEIRTTGFPLFAGETAALI